MASEHPLHVATLLPRHPHKAKSNWMFAVRRVSTGALHEVPGGDLTVCHGKSPTFSSTSHLEMGHFPEQDVGLPEGWLIHIES